MHDVPQTWGLRNWVGPFNILTIQYKTAQYKRCELLDHVRHWVTVSALHWKKPEPVWIFQNELELIFSSNFSMFTSTSKTYYYLYWKKKKKKVPTMFTSTLEGNTSQLSFNLTRGILSAKARWEKRDRLQNRRLQVPDDILYLTHIQYWRFLKPQQQRHGERGDSGTVTQLLWTPQLQSKSGAPVKSYCSSCNSFNTSPLGLHYLDSCQNTTHVRYESFHFLFFGFYISS